MALPAQIARMCYDSVSYRIDYAAVNAGAFISVIPVLLVYLALQRYFIEGIALTGLKA